MENWHLVGERRRGRERRVVIIIIIGIIVKEDIILSASASLSLHNPSPEAALKDASANLI
jgi:hypothetical protein